jgi:hypothetical protein
VPVTVRKWRPIERNKRAAAEIRRAYMKALKMMWFTEGGRLVCRWVDSEEQENRDTLLLQADTAGSGKTALSAESGIETPGLTLGRAA